MGCHGRSRELRATTDGAVKKIRFAWIEFGDALREELAVEIVDVLRTRDDAFCFEFPIFTKIDDHEIRRALNQCGALLWSELLHGSRQIHRRWLGGQMRQGSGATRTKQ